MKKVLIISLAFPPVPNVGVFRIAKFCKYLPEAGWQPLVLTQKAINFHEGTDWTPLDGVNKNLKVKRTRNFQPFYWWDHRSAHNRQTSLVGKSENISDDQKVITNFSIKKNLKSFLRKIRMVLTVPDDRLAWIPQAILPALKYIKNEKIDMIVSSSPSPTNHILGFFLSHLTGLPHVVDFRDLWTLNEVYSTRNLPPFLEKYDQFWEKKVLGHSKSIVVVNQTLKKQLVKAYPDICKNKVKFIYNGVDEDDFKKIILSNTKNDRFSIIYAGSLYGHRSPEFFLGALKKWIQKDKIPSDKIKVDFYGSTNTGYDKKVNELGLDKIVFFHPRITKGEIMQILFNADLSLLIHGFNKLTVSSTSTKLFEYMATGKPILAMMPESEASEILQSRQGNCVVSEPETDRVIAFLQKEFDKWNKQNKTDSQPVKMPAEFTRKHQALQLGSILDKLIGDKV